MLQKQTVCELNMQYFSLLCFGSPHKIMNLFLTRPEFIEIQHRFTRDGEYCRHTDDIFTLTSINICFPKTEKYKCKLFFIATLK